MKLLEPYLPRGYNAKADKMWHLYGLLKACEELGDKAGKWIFDQIDEAFKDLR